MDDRLIDDERISLHRRSLLPGEGFFTPDSFDDEVAEREAKETIEGTDRIVVADPDADGLGCVALIRAAFGTAGLLPAGPHELADTLEYVVAYGDPGLEVYVCDLCPDSERDLEALPAVADLRRRSGGSITTSGTRPSPKPSPSTPSWSSATPSRSVRRT